MAEGEEKTKENFIRLLTFITGPVTETLHLYFEFKVLNSVDFVMFLDNHKHTLVHQFIHPCTECCECKTRSPGETKQISRLTPSQFDLLFETDESKEIHGHKRTKGPQRKQICLCSISAKRTTSVDFMDISLMSAVLTSCCPPGSISGNPKWIKDIKETRNLIAHSPSDKISKSEYDQKLSFVEGSLLNIADVVGPMFLKMTKEKISTFKDSDLLTIINKDLKKNNNDNIRQILEKFIEEQKRTSKLLEQQNRNLAEKTEAMHAMISEVFRRLEEQKAITVGIGEMLFDVKTVVQNELPKAAYPIDKTVSHDPDVCYVEWRLATPKKWNVDEIKEALENTPSLIGQKFHIEFVYKGSLLIQTKAPMFLLQNYKLFVEAVESFLRHFVDICGLDTEVKTIVKVELVVSKEKFASQHLDPEKMETSTFACDPCSSKKHSSEAIQYCYQCQDNLCQQCFENHNLNAAFSHHNLTSTGILTFENNCSKHESLTLDFFCVEHDCLCCRACITSEHSCCHKLVPLEDAAKDVKQSVIFQDISFALSNIAKTLDTAITNQDENIKSLDGYDRVAISKQVASHKSGIIKRLDELEDKIRQDSYYLKEEQKLKSESSKKKLIQIVKPIKHMFDQVNIVLKYGSHKQLFVLLNRYKLEISDYENKLKAILPTLKTRKITFHPPDNFMNTFISLGSTRLNSMQYNADYQLPRMQQVQVPISDKSIQMTSKFTLHSKIEIKRPGGVWISSIGITDENRLLLCNFYGRNILLYSEKGDYLHDCKLSGEPWDIAVLSGEDKSVATQPHQHSIQFINTKTMKPGSTHSVPGDCYAIAVVNDKICVGGHQGYLYIVDKQGQYITTVRVANAGRIDYLHSAGPHDTVYYIDSNHMAVYCVNLEGHRRFRYTPKDLKIIRSVITDKEGNMYLAGNSSYNIQRLTPNGKFLDVILDEGNFIKNPIDMVFSNDCRKLFVLNQDKNNTYVLVFSCL
ncbi:Hypothetical predicted protein [Mytilus galloprovincialis]|uniref:B box-type domain-containing protein n=1 Tax=Mytilus galloprovincialis TaxID=29158 RepID=A0A8B6C2P0_MYTGA|nr:Hypothetical predicted protein [Mytilus galloprovincialis]